VQGAFELLGSGRSGKIILLIEMGGERPIHVRSAHCIGCDLLPSDGCSPRVRPQN